MKSSTSLTRRPSWWLVQPRPDAPSIVSLATVDVSTTTWRHSTAASSTLNRKVTQSTSPTTQSPTRLVLWIHVVIIPMISHTLSFLIWKCQRPQRNSSSRCIVYKVNRTTLVSSFNVVLYEKTNLRRRSQKNATKMFENYISIWKHEHK
jgi:uncharacterized membrane protein